MARINKEYDKQDIQKAKEYKIPEEDDIFMGELTELSADLMKRDEVVESLWIAYKLGYLVGKGNL